MISIPIVIRGIMRRLTRQDGNRYVTASRAAGIQRRAPASDCLGALRSVPMSPAAAAITLQQTLALLRSICHLCRSKQDRQLSQINRTSSGSVDFGEEQVFCR